MALNYIQTPQFDEYKELFKDYLVMERKNGIISMRMHTEGKSPEWSMQMHNAVPSAFKIVGMDQENEVLIFTSTPPYWVGEVGEPEKSGFGDIAKRHYDLVYRDAIRMVESPIFDIDIPSIGVITGPGFHWETALLCDISICSENTRFDDNHFDMNYVPGDGCGLILQHLLGTKRASYLLYTTKQFDAQTALEWGFVNEVLPTDKLMDRAWELAEQIMQKGRECRRLTSQLVKRPWKNILIRDMQMHVGTESYGSLVGTKFNKKEIQELHDRWERQGRYGLKDEKK